jgi:predicted ferric reductase
MLLPPIAHNLLLPCDFLTTNTGHFFLTKWQEQEVAVPAAAPHRMLKRLVPSLEFGAMHAILFQMALIPLSMSRFSIAALSESIVDRFVPLNRAVRIHIHLGYTMVTVVVVATLLFFGFFGAMCIDGEQAFCDKFRSEIMITGYCIFAFMLIIVGTSYFRHKIPYELFYAIHHLVFLIYITTIVHTFDNVQRKGQRSRSQTFVWFSATLIYYLCDRAAMYVSHRYQARLISSSTVSASNGSRMVVLRLRRPVLFNFKPGQYAYLRLDCIDGHWHPFSIASGPDSSTIEFYIEVCGESSWTGQLWALLDKERGGVTKSDMSTSKKQMWFEVMGPYGSSLGARPGSYSHVLAIGAGTGMYTKCLLGGSRLDVFANL